MRSGFQINYRHSVGNLHIYLCGEFNGMCAWELIKTIRRQRTDAGRIFVNTADLKQVVSAGAYMFKSHMTRKQLPSDWLYFKGEKGFKIAPDGSRVIISKKWKSARAHFEGLDFVIKAICNPIHGPYQ